MGPGVKPRDDTGVHGEGLSDAALYSHSIVPGGFDVTS